MDLSEQPSPEQPSPGPSPAAPTPQAPLPEGPTHLAAPRDGHSATVVASTTAAMVQPDGPDVAVPDVRGPDGAGEATTAGGAPVGAVVIFVAAVSSALIFSFLCSIFESVLLSVSRGHVEAASLKSRHQSRSGAQEVEDARTSRSPSRHDSHPQHDRPHRGRDGGRLELREAVFGPEGSTLGSSRALFTLAVPPLLTEIIPKTLGGHLRQSARLDR